MRIKLNISRPAASHQEIVCGETVLPTKQRRKVASLIRARGRLAQVAKARAVGLVDAIVVAAFVLDVAVVNAVGEQIPRMGIGSDKVDAIDAVARVTNIGAIAAARIAFRAQLSSRPPNEKPGCVARFHFK